jgi:pimeloyl-ACP methyl ester carboxylesterase
MNRRHFILVGAALGLAGAAPPAAPLAAPFRPTRFSVELRGRGPDVILIPGLTAGRDVWRATADAKPGYRFHLIQVSGFAGEPARGNRTGAMLPGLADELARYIIDRRLERPAIVGHSMGGTLAMMIAGRYPLLAGRIMVVDMLAQPAALFGGSAAGWAPLADLLGTQGGQRLFASFMGAFSPPDTNNRRSDPEVVARATRELMRADTTAQLPRIRVPMTVVYAVPDRQAEAAIDRQFAAAYASARGARLVRIGNSGHMVMLDQPARFRAALAEFLRR